MLGRVANNLFWMARHLERAENNVRFIEVAFRQSLSQSQAIQSDWSDVFSLVGANEHHSLLESEANQSEMINYLLREKQCNASIITLIYSARENGRTVRSCLTREVWQAINDLWLLLSVALKRKINQRDFPHIFTQIRQGIGKIRGALEGTMLRNDIFNFILLGLLLERCDNTTRILNAKYFLFLPPASVLGDQRGTSHWDIILQFLGAMKAYNWLNKGDMKATEILEFIIRDERLPRSLHYCYKSIVQQLISLETSYGNPNKVRESAEEILSETIMSKPIESLLDNLNSFLSEFKHRNTAVSNQLETEFNFNPHAI
tara:strand:- start:3992 stop:4942 length:951 start_codon:yes stop_codon:yes gene_type:complete